MNDDLISRSALRKAVNDFFDNSFKGIVSSDLIKYAEAVDELIDNAPTVDTTFREVVAYECGQKSVEERPKGKWIRTGSIGNGNAHYTCSNCSYGDEHAESQEVPYCWHCGADMRGDV